MENYNKNWLPHLENSIPELAMGGGLSMYTIALEGWRRGLILKLRHLYYKKEEKVRIGYSLSYKGRTHHFNASRGDKVSKEAINICNDKNKTRDYLTKAKVPTPTGKGFVAGSENDEIIQFADSIGYPLVLKPTKGLQGKGVIVNIKDKRELEEALVHVREKLNFKDVIIEEFVQGEDCRIYVIEDKVIGAVSRVPANVVGDGKNTIRQLIDYKNKIRNNNPNHYRRSIAIDDELVSYIKSEGFTLDSIPSKGKRVFLKKTSNISSGGEPIDITDDLSPEIIDTAINAAKSIPGLVQCAVDMLVNRETSEAAVIEVNSKPLIGLHLFPEEGEARDIPKSIIDYYFPETKNSTKSFPFYFDYESSSKLLRSGATKEITVKKVPQYSPISIKLIVSGNIENIDLQNMIRKKALSVQLNGYTEIIDNKKISIVIVGKEEVVNNFKKWLENNSPNEAIVESITEQGLSQPIKMGFYIK
ncbi:ATP-binding protein [Oceanobacillus sp. FSL W7-1309]|uniref:ATP-binding protein n=1 Tax=Oceanobacillus sp. FSL W7-1309 TaxID=2954539 RepID=UPI000BA6A9D1|nr:hypothetical protein CHI07_03720 [Paenibacillus sp. 7884-2]